MGNLVGVNPTTEARLTRDLTAGDKDHGWYRYQGRDPDTGHHVVVTETHDRRDFTTPEQARAWLAGYTARVDADNDPPTKPDPAPVAAIRRVLVHPTLPDLMRTQLRHAIAAAGVTRERIAQRLDVTPKTVTSMLRWGAPEYLIADRADTLMGIAGGAWHIVTDDPADLPDLVRPVAAMPYEPAGLRLLRAMVIAHEHGWARFIPTGEGAKFTGDPNFAARAKILTIGVGTAVYEVRTDTGRAWLLGVADAEKPEDAHLIT
ncbi:MAG: hypothetical protein EPO06_11845 [Burkholderiaceae bacterium]|nr:MAG: hypothetical protein EPO06_11845 [Burkholderiaceae bacterium]